MYVRGYLQGSENGRVVTIGSENGRVVTIDCIIISMYHYGYMLIYIL
jgi:hypothetical protein